ncbi:hypothetical protein ABOM_001743 [Aspergillus bombycis]|uniref:Apple domain-containing protein n=1 Tax=Aspergillus bombycis TaxID=109264 RepID=A0A1F8ACN9_9EURO|nr:hypothetical protein ABOM_001743 [Aspergillus bombycis]OGM49504.1 hypothetical protein ABOM_001743 [Aspergillus bombycis]
MATRSGLLLLALVFTPTWSEQTPTCLSPTSTGGPPNKDACCLGTGRQEESVDGVIYEYVCNHYATNTNVMYYEVLNAYECAKKCSETGSCHAASWKPKTSSSPTGGRCFLSTAGFVEKPDRHGEWLLLVRTDRTALVPGGSPSPHPQPDCQAEVDEAWAECLEVTDEDCEMRTTSMQQLLHAKDADIVNCGRGENPAIYISRSRKPYRAWCRRALAQVVNTGGIHLGRTKGLHECLGLCDRHSSCKALTYWIHKGRCDGLSTNPVPTLERTMAITLTRV